METKADHNGHKVISVSSRSFADVITHDKIHRHLTDINDTITEEDIRNVRTGIWLHESSVIERTEVFNNSKTSKRSAVNSIKK